MSPAARPVPAPAGRQTLTEVRRFLRGQVRTLFAAELAAMADGRAEVALAAADVLASFESYQLLTGDQGLAIGEARTVLIAAL